MSSHTNRSGHWFEHWFDENYLRLYRHRNMQDAERQVKLILETLGPTPSDHILDLGCGEGRHVKLFHNYGLNIIGLDLSAVQDRLC